MTTPFTVADLDHVFKRLGADGQIQLISHLAHRMDCSDGIDLDALASEYADTVCSSSATDGEREEEAESVLYPRVFRDGKLVADPQEAIAELLERDIACIQRNPVRRAAA